MVLSLCLVKIYYAIILIKITGPINVHDLCFLQLLYLYFLFLTILSFNVTFQTKVLDEPGNKCEIVWSQLAGYKFFFAYSHVSSGDCSVLEQCDPELLVLTRVLSFLYCPLNIPVPTQYSHSHPIYLFNIWMIQEMNLTVAFFRFWGCVHNISG